MRVIYAVASFCCLTRAPSHPADAFLEFFFSGHPGLGPVLYIYHLTRIPSEMAGKFFSSSRHVWKHGNLSTDAGGCISTAGLALGAHVKLCGKMPEKPVFYGGVDAKPA